MECHGMALLNLLQATTMLMHCMHTCTIAQLHMHNYQYHGVAIIIFLSHGPTLTRHMTIIPYLNHKCCCSCRIRLIPIRLVSSLMRDPSLLELLSSSGSCRNRNDIQKISIQFYSRAWHWSEFERVSPRLSWEMISFESCQLCFFLNALWRVPKIRQGKSDYIRALT